MVFVRMHNYDKEGKNTFAFWNCCYNINKGIKSLNGLNAHNHVQGLIVRNNSIIAKETSNGTKKMILSINKNRKNYAILIKFPKKKQDLRADLPTIGIDTLKDCNRVNRVIAIE